MKPPGRKAEEKFVLVRASNPGPRPFREGRSTNSVNQEASNWQREVELDNNSNHIDTEYSAKLISSIVPIYIHRFFKEDFAAELIESKLFLSFFLFV